MNKLNVILAGYNVDRDALEELVKKGTITEDDLHNFLTPESISAAYARISRDPKSVTELRKESREDVEQARKSNRAIVFKMGHHSVAEHAVLNFDVLNISRLAIETLESQRLCAYTEKSQRYITMEGDYMMPFELRNFENEFIELVEYQNNKYKEFYPVLKNYFLNDERMIRLVNEVIDAEEEQIGTTFPDEIRANKSVGILDGWAKEDARYVLSLASEGQLGFTTNARDLEKFIKYTAVHPLAEVQDLGRQLYELGKEIIPSLLLFTEPNDFLKNGKERSNEFIRNQIVPMLQNEKVNYLRRYLSSVGDSEVRLLDPDRNADTKLVAMLIKRATGKSFQESYASASALSYEHKETIVKKELENIEQWDALPREFELPDLTFEVVMSASAFAQFKRHRMMTLLPQKYNPVKARNHYTIPPSISESGLEMKFRNVMYKTQFLFDKVKEKEPFGADYILTNAHNRSVVFKANAREFYHISRFREDLHAQWDIRGKANTMADLARQAMPLTMMLLGGKHEFNKKYKEVYSGDK
ncbi:MAG: FAD-dependent thymidylate synthase [Nanoarchaeota archaeon]|nr:FAD-dependent thymidylate synthase [Nanoarchaeota archaeon]MBU1321202.1 FAD-dependent thymidylate synthase [Nanoarchaeota archaeon]MBU1597007.1 FAD-dependent thymidylate synthase [Nanoarchaeota archaeon]MBU2441847.1 FAD-dependent thymidylate synthase [Nanoarchaeota archaeon]